jgi:cell division protein FtsW
MQLMHSSASYDRNYLALCVSLLGIGLVMVFSASLPIAERLYDNELYFVTRHLIYLVIGILAFVLATTVNISRWQSVSGWLLLAGAVLLVAVLIPGIGRSVNGSARWLNLGFFTLQVSELVKLFMILYVASFLSRKNEEVRQQAKGFIKPMVILSLISVLLLKEPDFGATVVISATVLGMLFIAGAKLWQFVLLSAVVGGGLVFLASSASYRVRRLTSFLDPWDDPFGKGYQLTQSLIAFGRGDWFGVGLGNSVQKLEYLPEAHTDFVFAVYAEEFGFVGVVLLLCLVAAMVYRGFTIAKDAAEHHSLFASYTAFGISMWLVFQVIINVGANSGVLPTKGLTMPLVSYGGSSLIITLVAIGIMIRISYESKLSRPKITEVVDEQ